MRANARRLNTAAPMLWAALAFAGGIVLSHYTWRPPLWWLLGVAFAVGAAALFARRNRVGAFALGCLVVVALGALAGQTRRDPVLPPELAHLDGERVLVIGHVIREGAPSLPGLRLSRDSFDVEAASLQPLARTRQPLGPAVTIRAGIRVGAYSAGRWDDDEDAPSADAEVRYGQRLRFPATLRLPRNFGNPGSFDYRQYLLDRGIVAMATTRVDRLETLPGWSGSRREALRSRVRASILDHIGRLWPATDASTLDAMLVSERSLLDRDLRTVYQRTGIYHIIVVSGLNLAILAGFVYGLARLVRLGEWPSTILMLLAAVAFAWINDEGAPVWRATVMLAVYTITRLLYRERATLNVIGTAALLLLLVNPQALFDASFQLSFLAVLSLAAVVLPVLERTSAPWRRALNHFEATGYDAAVPPRQAQFRLDLRLLAGRVSRFVPNWTARWTRVPALRLADGLVVGSARLAFRTYELVVVSTAMQLCLALPMAWYFHRAITIGVPANLVAVPLAGIVLPMAAIAVACSYVSTLAAAPFAWIAALALRAIAGSAGALLALHSRDLRIATPSLWLVIAGSLAFAFAAWSLHRRRALALAGAAALVATTMWIAFVPPRPQLRSGVLEFTAIDVGQGESLLLATPAGKTVLIDAGGTPGPVRSSFDYGEDVVSPYLWQRGITRVDAVAMTHAHADHVGGLAAVIRNFRPQELWLGVNPDSALLRGVLKEARDAGLRVRQFAAGDAFDFGGTRVEVFSPAPGVPSRANASNNDSLVLRVRFGATSLLLPGDAEKQVERVLSAAPVAADVLQVPHHGSSTSSTPALLQAVHPRFGVISAGAHNSYGYPRADVLSRLAASRVATLRTDTTGAITFYLDGRQVEVRPPALR